MAVSALSGGLADDQVGAATAGQSQSLGDGARHAAALHHQVGAVGADGFERVLQGGGGVVGIDHAGVVVANSRLDGEGDPVDGTTDHDHRIRTGEFGPSRRCESNRPTALHDDYLPEPDRPSFAERTHHGRAGAR